MPLEDVIATEELARRPLRVVDAAVEQLAAETLATEIASSPRRVLEALAGAALELCHAQSAGVSLLEHSDGRSLFRWHAVAGEWSPYLWATMPREFSPCGTVLDRDETLLMVDPVRYFTPLEQVDPPVAEALLVPFSVEGELVGTLWIVSHDRARRFDAGDCRRITELSRIAASAYERLVALDADGALHLARLQQELRAAR